MPHDSALVAIVAAGLGLAFVFGLGAARLRLPPVVGYLVAGITVGLFTTTRAAGATIAAQGAELGIVLLMFGVGLHFSPRDLLQVWRVALPGSLAQILVTSTVGTALARFWGVPWGGAVVLGVSLSVASTVVVLKGLEARDRLDSVEGRLAVGWLVVEDVAMVLALVLLTALAPLLGGTGGGLAAGVARRVGGDGVAFLLPLGVALAKVVAFAALVFFLGRRAVPWLLAHVARLGSRELFTLAVLVTALGIGTLAAEVFGVSLALGAFFAGVVVSESELSQRAAADALPLQDAFAVLFFLSVGMLFDPHVLVERTRELVAVIAVVMGGKLLTTFVVMRLLGQPARSAIALGGSLAQIGEFSFIVAGLGTSLGLLGREWQGLVVAAALLSITANQPLFAWTERFATRRAWRAADAATAEMPLPAAPEPELEPEFDWSLVHDHAVVIGYGRVGATIVDALDRAGVPWVVVEEQERTVAALRERGARAVQGDATRPDVLQRAGIVGARLIVVTAPEPFRARRILEVARASNPMIAAAVRTHSATEQAYLERYLAESSQPGVGGRAVYAEREAALGLAHWAMLAMGRSDDDADWVISSIRGLPTAPTDTHTALHARVSMGAVAEG
jgi:CPA2 family monovalent cation:H+ antiporter-2